LDAGKIRKNVTKRNWRTRNFFTAYDS
jgi:hypothetical protein